MGNKQNERERRWSLIRTPRSTSKTESRVTQFTSHGRSSKCSKGSEVSTKPAERSDPSGRSMKPTDTSRSVEVKISDKVSDGSAPRDPLPTPAQKLPSELISSFVEVVVNEVQQRQGEKNILHE